MSNTRHTVVIRRDLNLVPGLLAAQVAHISDAWMRERMLNKPPKGNVNWSKEVTPMEKEWLSQPYLSVLAVNTGEELDIIRQEAIEAGLKVYVWEDVIPSEVLQRAIRVTVGISIGPDDFDRIKMVTGNLPLY
jgi:peptidyl-tRNA hydrolase